MHYNKGVLETVYMQVTEFNNEMISCLVKVILYSYLILKKMNERITDS